MEHFAKNILSLRKKLGFTQTEMHERLDVGRTTWSNYENGVSQPDFVKLIDIAKLFDVTVDDLLTSDLSNVEVNQNSTKIKKSKNVVGNVVRNVEVNSKQLTNVEESEALFETKKGTDQLILEHLINLTNVVNKLAKTIENKGI